MILKKNFKQKWFLNNFEVFHYFSPKDYEKTFAYLEIGSFEGLSALNVLYNYKNAKVFLIDLWSEANKNSEGLKVNFSEVEERFDKNLSEFSFLKIKSDSVIAMRQLAKENKKFDIIYIDGSHNGEDILSDAIEGFKLLNLNGIIIFDDIVSTNQGISKQSFEGFNSFIKFYNNEIKLLYLSKIAVIKKINY
tara:strand:- start:327 stop:902 length:576 start_codon:yes stop_codon:yes gene_type:complete